MRCAGSYFSILTNKSKALSSTADGSACRKSAGLPAGADLLNSVCSLGHSGKPTTSGHISGVGFLERVPVRTRSEWRHIPKKLEYFIDLVCLKEIRVLRVLFLAREKRLRGYEFSKYTSNCPNIYGGLRE